mgnify:CR=1 FL=1
MPVNSFSSSPASRIHSPSSEGRISLAYSWVPRGSRRNTYSAPKIAITQAFGLRLIVEKKTCPPGLTKA